MTRTRIALLVIGSILGLIGFGLLAGGAVLGWAVGTQRDDAGYFHTSTERFASNTAAITSTEVDLGDPQPSEWWSDQHIVRVRIRADSADEGGVFIGVASEADVEAYLRGVPHEELTSVHFSPFRARYRLENSTGTSSAADPTAQQIWVASATGAGEQTLSWNASPGRWALVIMNADGSAGVTADVQGGVRIEYLVQIAIGLAVAGVLLLGASTALIVPSVRGHATTAAGRAGEPVGRAGAPVPAAVHPVRLAGHLDPSLSRWQWLVKWFLAIPHFIVLITLWIAFVVLTIVAFFAIVFTGRYPRGIFDFNVGVLRWSWRVTYYCTNVMGTDRYPPFTLDDTDYPARLDIEYPEHLSRGLVWVKSWLLAIPHLVVVGVFTSALTLAASDDSRGLSLAGGLIGVLTLIAVVALLFTGRYPRDLHALLVGLNRWSFRVIAYCALMTDQYPPFRLDQGADEPSGTIGSGHEIQAG